MRCNRTIEMHMGYVKCEGSEVYVRRSEVSISVVKCSRVKCGEVERSVAV